MALQKGGLGISRFDAYQGTSLSKKVTLCPFLSNSLTNPLKVVACPFPQDEVMDKPNITISNFSPFIQPLLQWKTPVVKYGLTLMLYVYTYALPILSSVQPAQLHLL